MSFRKNVLLNTSASIPQIGLGTGWCPPNKTKNVVETAVKAGYRHLDLAYLYGNQREVGQALKNLIPSVVKREELFITSKLWNIAHQPAEVPKELDITLKELEIDYIDLYLIHWPVAFVSGGGVFPRKPDDNSRIMLDVKTTLVDTWKTMIELPKTGKVRAVGVSNFTIEQMEGIIAATGVVPAVNQIEAHPRLPQDELVAFCREKNIHITAYSPLGNNGIGTPLLTEHPTVKEVAKKLGTTEAQVLLAWGAFRGYSMIPRSVHEDHIVSNIKQVELSKEDYEKVSSVKGDKYKRYNIPFRFKNVWEINVFGEPEEAEAPHKPLKEGKLRFLWEQSNGKLAVNMKLK